MKQLGTWSIFCGFVVCSLGQTLKNNTQPDYEDVLKVVIVASTQILNDHGCELETDTKNLQDIQWWMDKRAKKSKALSEIFVKMAQSANKTEQIRLFLELKREVHSTL